MPAKKSSIREKMDKQARLAEKRLKEAEKKLPLATAALKAAEKKCNDSIGANKKKLESAERRYDAADRLESELETRVRNIKHNVRERLDPTNLEKQILEALDLCPRSSYADYSGRGLLNNLRRKIEEALVDNSPEVLEVERKLRVASAKRKALKGKWYAIGEEDSSNDVSRARSAVSKLNQEIRNAEYMLCECNYDTCVFNLALGDEEFTTEMVKKHVLEGQRVAKKQEKEAQLKQKQALLEAEKEAIAIEIYNLSVT